MIIPSCKAQKTRKPQRLATFPGSARNNPALGMMAQIMEPRRVPPGIEDLGIAAEEVPSACEGRPSQRPTGVGRATVPEKRCRRFDRQLVLGALAEIRLKFLRN